MSRLAIVSIVLDAARTQPARPLSEFFVRPRLPIREVYMYRFLVNLVWFARNYLNAVLVVAVAASVVYPLFLLTLVTTLQVHLWRRSRYAVLWKAAQLAGCVFTWAMYGAWPGVVTSATAMALIGTHAILTPYTDEASSLYDSATADVDADGIAPSTPVTCYKSRVSFEAAVGRNASGDVRDAAAAASIGGSDEPALAGAAPKSPPMGAADAAVGGGALPADSRNTVGPSMVGGGAVAPALGGGSESGAAPAPPESRGGSGGTSGSARSRVARRPRPDFGSLDAVGAAALAGSVPDSLVRVKDRQASRVGGR